MKLIDLLAVISDETIVRVFSEQDQYIAQYDGRDSIPSAYNERNVLLIDVDYESRVNKYGGLNVKPFINITIAGGVA